MSHKCNAGCYPNDCECELSSTHSPAKLTLVRSLPSRLPIQVTGGPVPRRRRVRRFLRALWTFLTASCFEP